MAHGLLRVEQRRQVGRSEGELALESYEVEKTAHMLTNVEGIRALSGRWRRCCCGRYAASRRSPPPRAA